MRGVYRLTHGLLILLLFVLGTGIGLCEGGGYESRSFCGDILYVASGAWLIAYDIPDIVSVGLREINLLHDRLFPDTGRDSHESESTHTQDISSWGSRES